MKTSNTVSLPQEADPVIMDESMTKKSTTKTRLFFIDNLRVFLTILVILHHLSIVYGASGGFAYVEAGADDLATILLTLFTAVNAPYFMGFFFLIAGYFTPGSYDRKGVGRFLKDRLVRLGIPVVVYMFTIHPLIGYLVSKYAFGSSQSFAESYTMQIGGYAQYGLGLGPLWFVALLLLFGIGYGLLRRLIEVSTHSAATRDSHVADAQPPSNLAIAGFALSRRSNRQYISERVNRLLIPFIVGSILLSPLQAYFEALHKGSFQGPFLSYIPEMLAGMTSGNLFTPLTFSRWGFHLYFLAFLFAYSLLALPIFSWFNRDAGGSLIAWLGRLVEKRGGILLFVIPLALVRVLVQSFPEGGGWLNFTYYFFFFVLGTIIYADDRFVNAVRRDRWLLFMGGVIGLVVYGGLSVVFGDQAFEWALTFVVPWTIILIFVFVLMSWGWALDVLYLAMNYLNFSNKWLVYGSDTIMPFYLLHQPVIIVIAYFVVQLDVGILPKLLVIVIGSFLITLALVELLVRPFKPMRRLFGMKPRKSEDEPAKTAAAV